MPVGFVIGIVAFKPDYFAVALKGEHMRGDAIQEPTVMGDDHGAAGEVEQGFFQSPQGFHVEVVGRFVQQQHVAAAFQQFGEVDAVAFAAGQVADALLLVAAFEVEAPAIGPRRRGVIADGD